MGWGKPFLPQKWSRRFINLPWHCGLPQYNTLTPSLSNTSTGSFSLTNEAYCGFTETGVWKGKEFFVSAGSTLVVSNTAALLTTSNITLSDDPDQETKSSILLGEGNYTADSMSVDGELLYRGTWGSSQSNARFKDDVHFKGPGVLTLNKGAPFPGLRLIVK